MDAMSSAKMMYTAVAMSEKQAAMKEKLASKTRRGKKDKSKSKGDKEDDGSEDVEELSAFNESEACWKGGCVLAALATVGTNIFSFLAFGGSIHQVAGVVASCAATTAAYREVTMDSINTVRKATNVLRQNVNRMAYENVRLSKEIDKFEYQVFCLKETEARLKDITGQQDLNVNNLVRLVEKNRMIQIEMQKLIRQDVIADVAKVVLDADNDESGTFDKREIKRLVRYISNLPSVKVNVELLQAALDKNKSVASVLDLVNDLTRDDIPPNDRIFDFNWDDPNLKKAIAEKQGARETKTKGETKQPDEPADTKPDKSADTKPDEPADTKPDEPGDTKPAPLLSPADISEVEEYIKKESETSEVAAGTKPAETKRQTSENVGDSSKISAAASKMTRQDSARSVGSDTSSSSARRPTLLRKSSDGSDLSRASRNLTGSVSSGSSAVPPAPKLPPSSETPSKKKKKGIIGMSFSKRSKKKKGDPGSEDD